MKSKWQVFTNIVGGEKFYQVKRIIDLDKPIHSGNLENSNTGIFYIKEEAQAIADRLNKEDF